MPNHIQNKLQVIGNTKAVKEVLTFIASKDKEGKKMQIDFNKIKPMPETLQLESGSLGEIAHSLLFGTKKEKYFPLSIPEMQKRFKEMDIESQNKSVKLAIQYQQNLELYGATTWYDWCCENWGTKWNAYSQNDERNNANTIYFQTAWSSPIELIAELSTKFPLVTFQLDYADEDSGSNTGKITMCNGVNLEVIQPEGQSKEGYDIYFELHPDSINDYKFVNGKYQYVDED